MGIQEKTTCIHDCNANTHVQEEKESKMIIQDQITPIGHYWENIPPDPTQKQRNKEKFKHIVYQNPKQKQLGTSPVKSPILLRRETSYCLGVPQQTT